jgi:hypothetical protein
MSALQEENPFCRQMNSNSYWSYFIREDIQLISKRTAQSISPVSSLTRYVWILNASSGEQSDIGLLEALRPQDSVKFVVQDETDCQYARNIIGCRRIPGEIFFSLVSGSDFGPVIEFIMVNNLPVRFQVQLHKLIGVK